MESRSLAYFRWHDCTSSSRIERNVEGDTLAGAARRELHSSGLVRKYVPGARWCVLSLVRRDKRSQMGSFRGRRGEKERKREREEGGAICTRVHTMVLIVGIAPNYATFCGQHDGDASPTRIILRCIKEENRVLLFFNYVLLRPSGRCSRAGHFPSRREIASPHIYSPLLFL